MTEPRIGSVRIGSVRIGSVSGKLALLWALLLAVAALTAAAAASWLGPRPWLIALLVLMVGLPLGWLAVARLVRPAERVLQALDGGVASLRAGDTSLRLAVDRRDELGHLVALYNELADQVGRQRGDLRQREILLHTVIEASPDAVLLINAADRVLVANRAARALFFAGRRLDGRHFDELLAICPEPLRQAMSEGADALVQLDGEDLEGAGSGERDSETFHVSRRHFEVNSRHHRLLIVKRLTHELRRQEVAVWKRVIRVISHELNNTVAPIRSLARSGKRLRQRDPTDPRLDEILDHIDGSATSLGRFVDGYRRFARLPEPRLEAVDLPSFLAHLERAESFRLLGEVPARTVHIDAGQIQQVLLNLVKNAREAESAKDDITIEAVAGADGGLDLIVGDRGIGLDEETMAQALLPFFSSKPEGTGLGLALSREILEAHGGSLRLSTRDGGGVLVTCRLPASTLRL